MSLGVDPAASSRSPPRVLSSLAPRTLRCNGPTRSANSNDKIAAELTAIQQASSARKHRSNMRSASGSPSTNLCAIPLCTRWMSVPPCADSSSTSKCSYKGPRIFEDSMRTNGPSRRFPGTEAATARWPSLTVHVALNPLVRIRTRQMHYREAYDIWERDERSRQQLLSKRVHRP